MALHCLSKILGTCNVCFVIVRVLNDIYLSGIWRKTRVLDEVVFASCNKYNEINGLVSRFRPSVARILDVPLRPSPKKSIAVADSISLNKN